MQPRRERVDPDIHASSRCFLRKGRRFAFEWHLHVEVELTLITAGSGRRFVGDTVERYGPGDLVLLGSELPHTWASDSASGRNAAVVAQFHPDAVEGWPELQAVQQLLEHAAGGLVFDAPGIQQQIQGLMNDSPLNRWLNLMRILDRLAQVPPGRARLLASSRYEAPSASKDPRISRVLAYLADHYREPIVQAQMAQLVALSPAAFARLFRRATGSTFTGYLQRLRVAHACQLLMDTDQSVTRIATTCGFNNLSNFNRVFRRWTRAQPSACRRHRVSR